MISNEHELQGLVARQLSAALDYEYDANLEERVDDSWRADIVLRPKRAGEPTIVVEVKSEVREPDALALLSQLLQRVNRGDLKGAYLVVAARRISPGVRHLLRDAGVGYWEEGGGCFIKAGSVRFERASEEPMMVKEEVATTLSADSAAPKASAFRPRAFSDRASRVTRALLRGYTEDRERWWTTPRLVEASAVSEVWVGIILADLDQRGFLERDGRAYRPRRIDALLAAWIADDRVQPKRFERFATSLSYSEILERLKNLYSAPVPVYALTGEAGAARLLGKKREPDSIELYFNAKAPDARGALIQELGLQSAGPVAPARVVLMEPAYPQSIFPENRANSRVPNYRGDFAPMQVPIVVSPAQLVLDLRDQPDRADVLKAAFGFAALPQAERSASLDGPGLGRYEGARLTRDRWRDLWAMAEPTLARKLGRKIRDAGRGIRETVDGKHRVCFAVSRAYRLERRTYFWYALHKSQADELKTGDLVAYFMDGEGLVVIPWDEFKAYANYLRESRKGDRSWRHVQLTLREGRVTMGLTREAPKELNPVDWTKKFISMEGLKAGGDR